MEPLRLRCSYKSYDWGRPGTDCTVARVVSRNSRTDINPDTTYAEFWMGTHDSGPSWVEAPDLLTLKSWISDNPAALGDKVAEAWGAILPFLFKVLSVGKALSIQAHPDKDLATRLHKEYPDLYKDDNHKPEMALAITEFKALCGFISAKELRDVIGTVPEIAEFVDIEQEDDKTLLRSTFTRLMTRDNDKVSQMVSKLTRRLKLESEVRMLTEKEELVLVLENQYPADIGVIAAFFLNYVKLSPGEALYLGANEPHAYISGECIECMATSDNVVRAGLTSKYRDVQTLCSMLTYKQGYPEILHGTALNAYTTRYTPPFDEFEVDRCLLPKDKFMDFPSITGPSIFLVVAGEGSMHFVSPNNEQDVVLKDGDVFFVPAQIELRLTSEADALQLYRAGVNSTFLG